MEAALQTTPSSSPRTQPSASPAAAMIEVQDLSKDYGSVRAVEGLTFTVRRGEVLGFLGPNGAGKTTTMKILTCFLAPTSGSARVNGHDVLAEPLEVRKSLGYLPENAPLYVEMTPIEFLGFVAALRGIAPAHRARKVDHIVDVCGIGEVRHREIRTLSKGYRQRVGLAQAMLHEPPLLILDEPTSGLDPNQIVEIRQLIKQVGRERTVILSTHNLAEVEASCGRVLIVHKGKLVADGKPEELRSSRGGATYRLVLRSDAAKSAEVQPALSGLKGVTQVRAEGAEPTEQALRLETSGDATDLRPELFRLAVDRGWTLLELRRDRVHLEDIFRQLTLGDADAAPPKA